jgi:hypothetical protein
MDNQSNSVQTFLIKHIEKVIKDPDTKAGKFHENSKFKNQLDQYVQGNLSLKNFSFYLAKLMYSEMSHSDTPDPADLITIDASVDDERFVFILKCNNKIGFTHQVSREEGKTKTDIIHHYAILPNVSQKLDEFVIVSIDSRNIRFNDKKRLVDGEETYIIPDKILECDYAISAKKAIELVNSITRKVSEDHGQSSVSAVTKAKNYIVENAEKSEYLDPVALGREVFRSSPVMQDEYTKELKSAGIPEAVKIDKAFAIRKGKNHKIKTDTGIEITFPVDYFENTDYIEFVNNPDGTISIELKNIGKLINK